ncbi:CPBP family intramembrane glutamic endopeptidase [Enterococcus casseliflavus]|uniref:CPBP family intramembrane glutamic endopeptidase n=1 Tax=Enterococcus casseliflavus TaxID=37734 RepID=UPI003DA6829B
MKLALTDSMALTKKERKRSITLAIIIGTILMIVVQTVVTEVPKQFVSNIGAQEVIALFVNIFVILAVLLFSRIFESRSVASFGFTTKKPLKNIGIGLLTGFVFLLFVFLVNLLSSSIEVSFNLESISWLYVIASFFGFLFQGTMEEVVCRGFIMNTVSAKTNVWMGVIINSIIFTALHRVNDSVTALAIFNLFLASLILSFIFYLSDNLLLVGAFHAIWNFMLGPFFGVPVSGYSIYSSIFQTAPVTNKTLINGGGFGFEGGLGLTIGAVLMLIVLFYFVKKKNDVADAI